MKKIIFSIALMLCFGFNANADKGINVGATLLYGAFSVDGASETFAGAHSSGASPGDVTKRSSAEGEDAEGDFGLASIFVEKSFNDKLSQLEKKINHYSQLLIKPNHRQLLRQLMGRLLPPLF